MHLSIAARPAPNASGGTRCEPSRSLTAVDFKYTPAIHTDLAGKFRQMLEQQRAQAAAKATPRRAKTAQKNLPLDAPADLSGVPRFLLLNQ